MNHVLHGNAFHSTASLHAQKSFPLEKADDIPVSRKVFKKITLNPDGSKKNASKETEKRAAESW